jgi:hypothetical protein
MSYAQEVLTKLISNDKMSAARKCPFVWRPALLGFRVSQFHKDTCLAIVTLGIWAYSQRSHQVFNPRLNNFNPSTANAVSGL